MEIEIALAVVILIAMVFLATVDLAFAHISDVGLRRLASEAEDEILVTAGQLVLTSPVQQTSRQIVALGQVIAPTGSETGLGAALSRMSGQIIYYPYTPGANVKSFTHSTTLSGAELANPKGNPSDILVAVGMLLITGRLESLGYDQIVALGPVIAPRDAEPILVGHVTSFAQGGVSYYDAEPRLFDGKETFSAGFFELLDQPTTLILDGKFTFADDVTPALLKAKLKEIIFDGKLIAPRALVPMLQILARQRSGKIVSADEDE